MPYLNFFQRPGARIGGASVLWFASCLLLASACVQAREGACEIAFPGKNGWERKTPEAAGLDAAKLERFQARVGGDGFVVRNGYAVSQWGYYDLRGKWGSASKPLLSTMLLFALHEGLIDSLDDLVDPWWDDKLRAEDKGMTLRHLANMVSGYGTADIPGEAWAYNDYAINLYYETLNRIFGEKLYFAAQRSDRLGSLDIQDSPIIDRHGRVKTSPSDFARVAWLWANKGRWRNTQLLPEGYFDAYVRVAAPRRLPRSEYYSIDDYLNIGSYGTDPNQTGTGPGVYGLTFWFNKQNSVSGVPAEMYQANGNWGRLVVAVLPKLKIVAAVRTYMPQPHTNPFKGPINANLQLLIDAVLDGCGSTGFPSEEETLLLLLD